MVDQSFNVLRIQSHQHSQGVRVLDDTCFQHGERGLGTVIYGLCLCHIQLRHQAGFIPFLGDFDYSLLRQTVLGNYIDLLLQFTQVDIGRCDLCTKRYHDGIVLFFGGSEILFLRFHPVTDTAEYVDFPAHGERGIGILGDCLRQTTGVAAALLPVPSRR